MTSFARTDRSLAARWWWTIDRWTLAALVALMGFGAILILAASPAVGGRLNIDAFHLANKQLVLLPIAVALLIGLSLLELRLLRRLATIGLIASAFLLLMTLIVGVEIKGASRWLSILGFSLQPAEFVKPFFAVFAAWMFAAGRENDGHPGAWIATGVWVLLAVMLLLQPDVGQSFLLTAIWGTEFFLVGLPLIWVIGLIATPIIGLVIAYLTLPHVTNRVDSFFDPQAGDRYQVNRSLEAFSNGGIAGRGPGEGTVKSQLPDAHSDFIFAVAGEEFGMIVCLLIVGLFAFVVLRGFSRVLRDSNLFVLLAVAGLLAQFGLQALINMASTLHLMPTKGMTLPFISYGGSSLLALAIAMGMVLALTRKRPASEATR